MARNILVTGGAGYIGSHTVRMLAEKGYGVTVYDNLTHGHEYAVGDVGLVKGDIGDTGLLKDTLRTGKIDAVIHFAAFAYVGESVKDPGKYYVNNVAKGISLLNAMVDSGVRNIVFSSSCATYGVPERIPITEDEKQEPINPYGRTKLMFEGILKDYEAYGLRSICLRYFNAAGADASGSIGEDHSPETHVIPLLLQAAADGGEFPVFGTDYDTRDGTCVRDYVHVTDLADAHVRAVEYLFENGRSDSFNLGTGNGTTVLELVAAVERVTGRRVNVRMEDRRPGDPGALVADNTKAMELLGWTPSNSSMDNIVGTAWKWHTRGSG